MMSSLVRKRQEEAEAVVNMAIARLQVGAVEGHEVPRGTPPSSFSGRLSPAESSVTTKHTVA